MQLCADPSGHADGAQQGRVACGHALENSHVWHGRPSGLSLFGTIGLKWKVSSGWDFESDPESQGLTF